MKFSLIVPAFNEGHYLPGTLEALGAAAAGMDSELLVVDNASTDDTGEVARRHGARVVPEPVHNIARVRNAGARAATGDILVFIDADTVVSPSLLQEIGARMASAACLGGAVRVEYTPMRRRWVAWYLKGWAFWGRVLNMKQGAAQFCRRDTFGRLGGYDESIHVGEDIEFYWRLARHARRVGGALSFITDPPVVTSSRRFDRMGAWQLLVLTHPVVIWLNWRRAALWKAWYQAPVR